LERVLALIEGEIGVLQVERKIRSRVKRQMEKTQREYYLNEQLKAIQKELGEGEEGRDELAEMEERIKKTKLSKEAREKAQAEVKKLRSMSPMSAEATVVRNYLDWMLSLPWGKKSKIKKDIGLAEKVLHEDHYGLDKVKERILEYLAVQHTHSVSRKPCALAFRVYLFLAVGPLSLVVLPQIGCSRSTTPFAKSQTLSPVELFQKVSPSVFVVEALDENGKTLVLGSAVAIARDFLITNCHVVENGSSLTVHRGKETWNARLIQAVSTHDLCGLRPSGLTLQPVEVRPSSKLATGEHVYAIGSPEGLELTFSEGVISALRETDGVRMIQTSAPISPGSSGGGLFDSQGNLVGVTTFFLKEGQSLNFALPGEWVTDVLARSRATAHSALSDATLESAAWIDIGLEAVKKEDYDLALHSFSKCVALKESDAYRAWFEIGKIWHKSYLDKTSAYRAWFGPETESNLQDAETKAASAFERTIQLRPDYAEAWRELASTYGVEHKEQQALDAAKEAARLDPRNRRNWSTLGVMYYRVNSYKKAIDALQQALRTQPNDSSVPAISDASLLYMIGLVYSEEGDREHVLEIYTKLKAIDPKVAEDFFRERVLPQPSEHPSKE